MKTLTCFKPTSDDWYPNFPNNLVKVSFMTLGPDATEYRVCIWGNDDCGMERDYDLDFYEDAKTLFTRILQMETVNKQQLKELGMVTS